MTSLVLSALPFAVAVVGFVVATTCTVALAIDFFTTTDKKRPRPCEARAHETRRRYTP